MTENYILTALFFAVLVLLVVKTFSAAKKKPLKSKPVRPVNNIAILVDKDDPDYIPRVNIKWRSDSDNAEYYAALAKNAQLSFEMTKRKSLAIGATYYIWHTAGDSDVCKECRKKNGKRFRFNTPPVKTGHPGDGLCCKHGHCRCFAAPVIPK